MARPKYCITSADSSFARRWVETKLANPAWLGPQTYEAHQSLVEREETASELNAWCETWLHDALWIQLKNAIRAARRRAKVDDMVSVTLSRNAWGILSYWAQREGCTLSEIIERRIATSKHTNE
jgi:macrodomain Ter protein organizer (MatP/YcbG family)